MFQVIDVVQDKSGNALYNAAVQVFSATSGDPTPIYYDYAGTQPITASTVYTDDTGSYNFFVPDGLINLTITYQNQVIKSIDNITIASVEFSPAIALPVYGIVTGAANALIVTLPANYTVKGLYQIIFAPNLVNTSAVTVALYGGIGGATLIGTFPLTDNLGNALVGGELQPVAQLQMQFNAGQTALQLTSGTAAGSVTRDAVTVQTSLNLKLQIFTNKAAVNSYTAVGNVNYPSITILGADGGTFNRIASNTTSAEDGGTYCGTIIRPADYAANGIYQRQFSGAASVIWFGAKLDGTTDDTAAINAALASGISSVSILFTTPGVKTTNTLFVPSNTRLFGEGAKPVISFTQSGTNNPIIKGTGSGITIENLSLNGNYSGTTDNSFGIWLLPASSVSIGNTIKNCVVANTTSTGLFLQDQSNLKIKGNRLLNNGIAGLADNHGLTFFSSAYSCDGIDISGNFVTGSQRKGISSIALTPGLTLTNVGISNNTVENCVLGGIYIGSTLASQPLSIVTIENNRISNCYAGIEVVNTTNLNLTGNVVSSTFNAANTSGPKGSSGFELTDVTNSSISNNIAIACGNNGFISVGTLGSGYNLSTGQGNVWRGNTSINASRNGLGSGSGFVLSNVTGNKLSGNFVFDQLSAFTGSIAGNILSVTAVSSGYVSIGSILTGAGIAAGTQVLQLLSGAGQNPLPVNGTTTYLLSGAAQSIASESMTVVAQTGQGFLEGSGSDYNTYNLNDVGTIYGSLYAGLGAHSFAGINIVGTNLGIGTVAPNCALSVGGSFGLQEGLLALVNGNNNDVAIPAGAITLKITATAAFTITGIAGGVPGRRLSIHNLTAFACTLSYNDANSLAGNRLFMGGSASLVLSTFGSAILAFDGSQNGWIIEGYKA